MQNNKNICKELFSELRREIGDELRQIRLHKNMTLDEVYMETNVLPKYIDLLECGRRFNIDVLRHLAYFYRKKIKISLIDLDK